MATTSFPIIRPALLVLIVGIQALWADVGAASENAGAVTPEMQRQLTILHADTVASAYCGCGVSVRSMEGTGDCMFSIPDDAAGAIAWSALVSRRQLQDLARCSDSDCSDALDDAFRDLQLWVPMRQDIADSLANLQLGAVENATSRICAIAIDEERRVFMPAALHRGRIARVLLYLQQNYDLTFDSAFNQLLSDWHLDNPPTEAEAELNRWLTIVQGKGVSTSRVSIDGYILELEQRHSDFDFSDRIDGLREDVIETVSATNSSSDPEHSFYLAQSDTDFYVSMSADLNALRILQGDESVWQSIFDGLEAHWLASQMSQHKVGDVEIYGKMMSLAVITGQDEKAKAYASAYLHEYNQYRIDNYLYENHYPDLVRVVAHLIRDNAWPTDVDESLAGHPYGRMIEAGADNAMFAAALYDSGNYFLDMRGVILPYFRLAPFEFLAIVELRNEILGTESPRLAHPLFGTKLAAVPAYTTSNDDPILTLMIQEWGDLEPIPELIEIIVEKELGLFRAALDDGADPSARDHLGRTPLTLAAELNLTDFVSELVTRDADTGGDVGRALHSAIDHGNYEIARMLLEAGVDVNYVWRDGNPPSTSAFGEILSNPSAEIIELLFEHGIDISPGNGIVFFANTLFRKADPGEMESILDVLLENGLDLAEAAPFCQDATLEASADYLNLLIDRGADVNKRYISDATPLICAAQYGSLTATKVLLDRGADIRARNRYGDSALDTARDYGNEDIEELLLSYRR